jgi:hypothetical protein
MQLGTALPNLDPHAPLDDLQVLVLGARKGSGDLGIGDLDME